MLTLRKNGKISCPGPSLAPQRAFFIRAFILLTALFLLQRVLGFAFLLDKYGPEEHLVPWQALLVGSMSDLWIAGVLAAIMTLGQILLGIGGQLFSPKGSRDGHRGGDWLFSVLWFVFVIIATVLTAGHQAYVEFFKFPMILFHLSYLHDRAFMTSNMESLLGWRSLACLATGLVLGWVVRPWIRLGGAWTQGPSVLQCVMIFGLCIGLHNRNIHCREQWFIPENLQVHPLERLYIQWANHRYAQPLTPQEMSRLEGFLGPVPPLAGPAADVVRLHSLLTRHQRLERSILPVAQEMRRHFQAQVGNGDRPIALVALMESLRPAETGYFAPPSTPQPSLTPHLDALSRQAVVFTRAYATGSVTRGGQEAVFCGYLGSRETSVMRGLVPVSIRCLPYHVQAEGEVFWYHGGDGRFDQQENFWKSQKIQHWMTQDSFPRSAARTSWGVGDMTFFREVVRRLGSLREASTKSFLLGMALSVSNHFPWTLPADHDPDMGLLLEFAAQKSYVTTSYSDAALGAMVRGLKDSGLWPHLLLVIASDHGNLVPPYRQLYRDSPHAQAELMSHINLLLVGGVVEAALAQAGQKSLVFEDEVSQADIAPLLAYVTGYDGVSFPAENPFAQGRRLPVISVLEDEVYAPGVGARWSRGDLAAGSPPTKSTDEDKASLFYRAFLQFVSIPGAKF